MVATGQLGHALAVDRPTGQRLAERDGVHAGVAGGGDDRVHVRVRAERLDEGVLAGTGTDDEDLHGAQPRAALLGHGRRNGPDMSARRPGEAGGTFSRGRRAADVRSPGGGTCNHARGSTGSTSSRVDHADPAGKA